MKTNTTMDKTFSIMKEAFEQINSVSPDDNVRWTGPMSDLVELSHLMWSNGFARDIYGRRECYKSLLHRLCDSLHVRCPSHHTAVINNIRRRKFAESSLYYRCADIINKENDNTPIERFLERKGERTHISRN